MTLWNFSRTTFLNLYKLSTWSVFENLKHKLLQPKVMIKLSLMFKWLLTSLGINPLITRSIIIKETITFCDNNLISCLETSCGKQLECILEHEHFNDDLWSGPCVGVDFLRKLLLLPVKVLWKINVELYLDPNDPDELNSAFIISMSIILIFPYWNMSIFPTKIL